MHLFGSTRVEYVDPIPGWVPQLIDSEEQPQMSAWSHVLLPAKVGRKTVLGPFILALRRDMHDRERFLLSVRYWTGDRNALIDRTDPRADLRLVLPVDHISRVRLERVMGRSQFVRGHVTYIDPTIAGLEHTSTFDFTMPGADERRMDLLKPLHWEVLDRLLDRFPHLDNAPSA